MVRGFFFLEGAFPVFDACTGNGFFQIGYGHIFTSGNVQVGIPDLEIEIGMIRVLLCKLQVIIQCFFIFLGEEEEFSFGEQFLRICNVLCLKELAKKNQESR